jgi:hypothetical protein
LAGVAVDSYTLSIKPRSILILTAIQMEARAVAKALGVRLGQDSVAVPGISSPLWIRTIGMRAADLPTEFSPDELECVILAGFAGALSTNLGVGDIVIEGTGKQGLHPDWHLGKIHTSRDLLESPDQKSQLFAQTGALAVDMEAAIVQEWLERGMAFQPMKTTIRDEAFNTSKTIDASSVQPGPEARATAVPFIHLRAISDSAVDAVNPIVMSIVDCHGRIKAGKLAVALLLNPSLIWQLLKLGSHSKHAAKALGQAICRLLMMRSSERAGHDLPTK